MRKLYKFNVLLWTFIVIGIFFMGGQAWAVVGTASITVNDENGNPVPNAVISLPNSTAPPTKTDENGKATIDVEEGTYNILVDGESTGSQVTVKGGQTTSTAVTFPRSQPYLRVGFLNPRPLPANSAVGPYFSTNSRETPKRSNVRTRTLTARGTSITETKDLPPETSFAQKTEIENEVGGELWLALRRGAPAFGSASGFFANGLSAPAEIGGSRESAGGPRFYPVVSFHVGQADLELEVNPIVEGVQGQSLRGDGLSLGGGVRGVLLLCRDCGWWTNFGYRFKTLRDIDMVRSPALQPTEAGISILRDDIQMTYRTHTAEGMVGYTHRKFSAWGGARGVFSKMEAVIEVEVDFSQFFGEPVNLVDVFNTDFENDTVEGIVGGGFHLGRLLIGAEGSFNGDNSSVHTIVAYAF